MITIKALLLYGIQCIQPSQTMANLWFLRFANDTMFIKYNFLFLSTSFNNSFLLILDNLLAFNQANSMISYSFSKIPLMKLYVLYQMNFFLFNILFDSEKYTQFFFQKLWQARTLLCDIITKRYLIRWLRTFNKAVKLQYYKSLIHALGRQKYWQYQHYIGK